MTIREHRVDYKRFLDARLITYEGNDVRCMAIMRRARAGIEPSFPTVANEEADFSA